MQTREVLPLAPVTYRDARSANSARRRLSEAAVCRVRSASVFVLCTLGCIALSALAAGEQIWEHVTFPGIPANEFAPVGGAAVAVESSAASSLIYRPLVDDEAAASRLTWAWRVEAAPPPTDLAARPGDDRTLAVAVWFPTEEAPPWWQRLIPSARDLAGIPSFGRALYYTWGGDTEIGSVLPDPWLEDAGAIIVLRNAASELATWHREHVHFREDYRMAFGEPAPRAAYIAVVADTDDTESRSRSEIRDLEFAPDVKARR